MQYSRLQFTKAYDRPSAIAGLEQRLIRAFGQHGGFGVFDLYFGRSLLWRRENEAMRDISFPSPRDRAPSWSWMAYEGAIRFLDVPFDGVAWEGEGQIRAPWSVGRAAGKEWHTGDGGRNSYLTGKVRGINVEAAGNGVVFDKVVAPGEQRTVRCVIVGRQKTTFSPNEAARRHYVLVVARKHEKDGGGEDGSETYERVGVGAVPGSCIVLDGPGLQARIS